MLLLREWLPRSRRLQRLLGVAGLGQPPCQQAFSSQRQSLGKVLYAALGLSEEGLCHGRLSAVGKQQYHRCGCAPLPPAFHLARCSGAPAQGFFGVWWTADALVWLNSNVPRQEWIKVVRVVVRLLTQPIWCTAYYTAMTAMKVGARARICSLCVLRFAHFVQLNKQVVPPV